MQTYILYTRGKLDSCVKLCKKYQQQRSLCVDFSATRQLRKTCYNYCCATADCIFPFSCFMTVPRIDSEVAEIYQSLRRLEQQGLIIESDGSSLDATSDATLEVRLLSVFNISIST